MVYSDRQYKQLSMRIYQKIRLGLGFFKLRSDGKKEVNMTLDIDVTVVFENEISAYGLSLLKVV